MQCGGVLLFCALPRSEDREKLIDGEISLTGAALRRQPKSYLTWLHRRWTTSLALNGAVGMTGAAPDSASDAPAAPSVASTPASADGAAPADAASPPTYGVTVQSELKLCGRLLELDHRNFHCHNHRRWLLARGAVPAADDERATRALLAANPSNYSAWHQRSHALSCPGRCGLAASAPLDIAA